MTGSPLGRRGADGSQVNERQRLFLAACEELHGAGVSVLQPALELRGDPAGSRGRLIYKRFNLSRFEFSLFEKYLTLVCVCESQDSSS